MNPFQTHNRKDRQAAFWLFAIGLFSMTQIRLGAKLGISEFGCCAAAPYLFCKYYRIEFKRDGVQAFFWLLVLWMFGAIFSDLINHSIGAQIIRGFSVPLVTFSSCVCIYHNLRKNPANLSWLLFGLVLSSVLSIFVFQRGTAGDIAAAGRAADAVSRVVGYKLFWANMAAGWLSLPIFVAYHRLPKFLVCGIALGLAVFNLIGAGGRSMFLTGIVSFCMLFFGGKSVKSLLFIRRHFLLLLCLLAIVGAGAKSAYKFAVQNGLMGEEELKKYEAQTSKGSGPLALLMAGRKEFFIGLFTALDRPLIGHGSQAIDNHGYMEGFYDKYGTEDEIKEFREEAASLAEQGVYMVLPSHSHIVGYWMWHGVSALIFWLYVLWLIVVTLKGRLHFVPAWYGYFAMTLPALLWDIFFSPNGLRVNEAAIYCSLLFLIKAQKESARRILI